MFTCPVLRVDLNDDSDDSDVVVRHLHQQVHNASQLQRLEGPSVGGCDSNDRFEVVDSELPPLLLLNRLNLCCAHSWSRSGSGARIEWRVDVAELVVACLGSGDES
ncbi:hypothetical protein ACFX1X_045643 [Malus domestica]